MVFNPRQQVSIHGKALALNTTGALMVQDRAGTKFAAVVRSSADVVDDSTALLFAQLGVSPGTAIPSTVGSTLPGHGFVSIASGTDTGLSSATTFEIGTPETPGVTLTIHLDTSASQIVFGGTSTALVYQPAIAGAGSSLFISDVAPLAGTSFTLMGFDSSEWALVSRGGSTATFTIG